MTTTTHTPNRYAGTCTRCHSHVPAGTGALNRDGNNRWAVTHLTCPDAPAPAAASIQRVTTDGIYSTDDGTIYKVQHTRDGLKLYAKRMELVERADGTKRASFTYAPGVIHTLRPEHRMTVEQAQVFGRLTQHCVVCGAHLENPESVALGIGPVCRASWFA